MLVTIVPMTIDDYDDALALWQHTAGMGLHLADVDSRDGVARYLRRNAGLSLVARRDGALVGTLLCGHDGRRGYVHHLAVRDDCRRRGIARALLARGLAALQAEGIVKCNIVVYTDNGEGRRFWEHAGWTARADLVTLQIATAPAVEEPT